MKTSVHTVSGHIACEDIGNILTHEHILCFSAAMKMQFGHKWFDEKVIEKLAIEQLKEVKREYGINTIIDGTPVNLGRDIELLKRISDKSEVNIIVSSGLYHTEDLFVKGKSVELLADYFIYECENGILDSMVKPQILKCATGVEGVTRLNKKILDIMSLVQKKTNLPLYVHAEHSIESGIVQLGVFEENEVDLKRVIIGHCSDSKNLDYLLSLAKSGCYLGFDRIYPSCYKEQAKIIKSIIDCGLTDHILLSHDNVVFSESLNMTWNEFLNQQKERENGYTLVHGKLIPELKALGVNNEEIRKISIENPMNMLFDRRN